MWSIRIRQLLAGGMTGILEPPNGFSAILAIGEGQKEVQNIITPNIRVETIGWGLLSDLAIPKAKSRQEDTVCPYPSKPQWQVEVRGKRHEHQGV